MQHDRDFFESDSSENFVESLQQLRELAELSRADLYWSLQRVSRTRRHSAALVDYWHRRNALQVYTAPLKAIPPHAA